MSNEKEFQAIVSLSQTIGVAANLMAQELETIAINHASVAQGSMGEYVPLAERFAEFIEEPDRSAGFVLVGNDTWLPKHLVNARKRQRRRMSRVGESGVVRTR